METTVLVSPRHRSGGQWFYSRVWARDVTNGYGGWKNQGTAQAFIPEVNSMSYSMADYRELATSKFTGYDGHSYQIYVEAWAAYSGGQYEGIGAKNSNHYSSFGAYEPNIYGETLQRIPGASGSHCTVY